MHRLIVRAKPLAGRRLWSTLIVGAALIAVATSSTRAVDAPEAALTTVCGVHDPEDVEWVASMETLLVSETGLHGPGAISAAVVRGATLPEPHPLWPLAVPGKGFAPDPQVADAECTSDAARDPQRLAVRFKPHGIASLPLGDRVRVVAVDHGDGETIDVFDLFEWWNLGPIESQNPDLDRPVLVWRGCLRMPHGARGNDLSLTVDGDVVVANMGTSGLLRYGAAFLGARTGELLRWSHVTHEWSVVPGTEARAPNGVLATDDGSIYYSESAAGRVWRVTDGRSTVLAEVGGVPDNLALAPDGRILVTRHDSVARFVACGLFPGVCHSPWALFALDPTTSPSSPRPLLSHDGRVLGGVSSVAVVKGSFVFGAVFGNQLGVWRSATATEG